MTIVAMCLGTCFIALNHNDLTLHGIHTEINALDHVVQTSIASLKMFETTVNLRFQKHLHEMLEKSITDRVNPTLEAVKRTVNTGDENTTACYEATKESMINLTKEDFNAMIDPCLSQFRVFIVNSLVGVPELIVTLQELRTRMDDLFRTCESQASEEDPVTCATNKFEELKAESNDLTDVTKAFTKDAHYFYSLAHDRFVTCMTTAGSALETKAKELTEDGTKCAGS